jgi:hypothetical protein
MQPYVFGKTDFMLDVLRRVGLTEEQLVSIERVNRRSSPRPAGAADTYETRRGSPTSGVTHAPTVRERRARIIAIE